MEKPKKKEFEPVYDLHQIEEYIGHKHKLPGSSNWPHHFYDESKERTCFWHVLLNDQFGGDVSHGCRKLFSLNPDHYDQKFMKVIIGYFREEFLEDANEDELLEVWIDW